MKLTIIGCGRVGRKVSLAAKKSSWQVFSSNRQRSGQSESNAFFLDLDQAQNITLQAGNYLYLVPPPRHGESDPRLTRFLSYLPTQPCSRITYVSTSGVYGDCQGEWVDESRVPNPTTGRAIRRLHAERQIQHWAESNGHVYVILRVGGIYGPDRLPVDRLEKKLPVLAESESPFVNRIHVDDLVQVCLASFHSEKNQIYNVSDGHPGTMTDYFNQVADYLGMPRPPQVPWSEADQKLTPELISYLRESRRLDSNKMLNRLGISLIYPHLAAGLSNLSRSF